MGSFGGRGRRVVRVNDENTAPALIHRFQPARASGSLGAMRSRLEVRITPADVGSRVSVRSRIAREHPSAPSTTDTLGYLLAWTDDELQIQRRNGEIVRVATADLLAGKVLPGPPPQRRGR